MRAAALALCAVAACAPAIPRVEVAPAPPPNAAAHVGVDFALQCKTPPSPGPFGDQDVDAFFFGTCAAFEPVFYRVIADSCGEAMPALGEALRAVADDRLVEPLPEPNDITTPRDRKSFTLLQASRAFVPARCTSDMNLAKFPVDDYGRSIADVSTLWRDVPSCRPDAELFALRTVAEPRSFVFEQGDVDVGVYMFALAIAPHLTPIGKQYLRKFLLCDELDHSPNPAPWKNRVRAESPYRGPPSLLHPDEP